MLELDYDALSALGLTPALAGRAAAAAADLDEGARHAVARIVEVHRQTVVVHDGRDMWSARPAPWLIRALDGEGSALAAGDWAIVRIDRDVDRWVVSRMEPVSHIARRDSDGRAHAIVSNVDVALLVMGLDDDFNPRRLERFVALVHDDAILKVVVLTKADVVGASVADANLALLRQRLPARVPILVVNAMDAAAARALQPYLAPGRTLVMLGSSGAGKSTLTNTLMGAPVQDTGPVRGRDGRGQHTTTSRCLHRLPGGACVIDTPGVRTLRPDADSAALGHGFADVEALAANCRFRDCTHRVEPHCAVRSGVDADRLRNYQKLLRELRRDVSGYPAPGRPAARAPRQRRPSCATQSNEPRRRR